MGHLYQCIYVRTHKKGAATTTPQSFVITCNQANNLTTMKQLLHDLRVFVWGVQNKHPNIVETRLQIGWPITLRRLYHPGEYAIRFSRPYIRIAAPFELEMSYLSK